jgi:hypothetical protein
MVRVVILEELVLLIGTVGLLLLDPETEESYLEMLEKI